MRLYKIRMEEGKEWTLRNLVEWKEMILCEECAERVCLRAYDFIEMGPTDGCCDVCGKKEN